MTINILFIIFLVLLLVSIISRLKLRRFRKNIKSGTIVCVDFNYYGAMNRTVWKVNETSIKVLHPTLSHMVSIGKDRVFPKIKNHGIDTESEF